MRKQIWTLVAGLLLAGCGGGNGTSNVPVDTSDSTVLPDGWSGDSRLADTSTDKKDDDIHIGPKDGYGDLELKEVYPDVDAMQEVAPPTCLEKPYEFGCPCSDNLDCEGVWCVDGPNGKVCTKECVEECPYGYSCQLMGGTCPDCQWLCVPKWSNLCRPCTSNNDCIAPGFSLNNVCIDSGAAGSFCGSECSTSKDCPTGYACAEIEAINGNVMQCVLLSGECVCSQKFIDAAASTNCYVENAFGQCPGKRFCGTNGLSACSANIPIKETCDGKDNDCDGGIDEEMDICGGNKSCKCVGQQCSCVCPDGLQDCGSGSCVDLQSDVNHCGKCNQPCSLPNVNTYLCQGGVCKILDCMPGWADWDKQAPGCECPVSAEKCDGVDNDCDGEVDEGEGICPAQEGCVGTCTDGQCICSVGCDFCDGICVTQMSYFDDPNNCGYCGNKCVLDNTVLTSCEGGNCCPLVCEVGYKDCDEFCSNGCEFKVVQETCNCLDDDCDEEIDNPPLADCIAPKACLNCACQCPTDVFGIMDCGDAGCIDITSNAKHCGWCDNDCVTMAWEHVKQYGCADMMCTIAACDNSYFDANQQAWDGCECLQTSVAEQCDLIDNNCNGEADEAPFTDCQPPKECIWGQCTCPLDKPNLQECVPNQCIDTYTDPKHCGFCGNECNLPNVAVQKCVDGQCVAETCKPGFKDCNEIPSDGCEFEVKPEECNGFDDDCDKEIDEGAKGVGAQCESGLPGVCLQGIQVCTNGMLSCKPNIEPGTINEVCDGKDNDCDGGVDEDNPGGGGPCIVQGLNGECKYGQLECTNGKPVCIQIYFTQPEECDGKDNDCDGTIDGMEEACFTMCGEGKKKCVNGQWGICSAMAPKNCKNYQTCMMEDMCVAQCPNAPAELCNGIDENCDGQVDEIFQCKVGDMKTQSCGNCGQQQATCGGTCTWGQWSQCSGEGVCTIGQSKMEGSCGNCGQQRWVCNNSCQWQMDQCLNQGTCSPGGYKEEGSCGNCGKYSYSCNQSCQWVQGTCVNQGVCSIGQTKVEGSCGNCGQQQYLCSSSCQWQTSTCLNQGICKPGSSKTEGSCGNCGSYAYSCSNSCQWVQGSCTGQGVCAPGATTWCTGCQKKTCSNSCQWGNCGAYCGSEKSVSNCYCDSACDISGDCCPGSGSTSACTMCGRGCNSCENTECGGSGGNCWCDSTCVTSHDCCTDARSVCGIQTCRNGCGTNFDSGCDCHGLCGWPFNGACCTDKTYWCG